MKLPHGYSFSLDLILAVNSSLAAMDHCASELVAEHSEILQYQLIDFHTSNQVHNNSMWWVWEYSTEKTTLICILAEAMQNQPLAVHRNLPTTIEQTDGGSYTY